MDHEHISARRAKAHFRLRLAARLNEGTDYATTPAGMSDAVRDLPVTEIDELRCLDGLSLQ